MIFFVEEVIRIKRRFCELDMQSVPQPLRAVCSHHGTDLRGDRC